jgi:ATP-dependent helicase HrpB
MGVLEKGNTAVLTAPPGSGKTTLVPLALLDAPWLAGKKIILLEPRRIAARLAASYMSSLLREKTGNRVGYQVRFERKISARTRIEVITEGLLCRRLQQDPELADAGLVIFDEFHERSLDSDLALSLCLDVQAGLREDLRLLVMSATMDTKAVSRLLGQAPVISGQGRVWPVTTRHLPPLPQYDSSRPDHISRSTVRAIRQLLTEEKGDMLVFLPGVGEIRRVAQQLSGLENVLVRPLYGGLKPAEQEQAIQPDPSGRQRIILATTIAETSVTIEGITVVIDCGWKRIPRFDANSGLSRLDTVRISRASAEQRAGRAGRLAAGSCYRLWHRGVEAGLHAFDRPEIVQADLAPMVLELAQWGVREPDQLSWLDPPPARAFSQGRQLLARLGAVDSRGGITTMGRLMAGLPLHPRLGKMVIAAGSRNRKQAIELAALLSEPDLLPTGNSADLENRLHCLHRFRKQGRRAVEAMGGRIGSCVRVDRVCQQLTRLTSRLGQQKTTACSPGSLLALAYPDRIGGRRRQNSPAYKLASGRGCSLRPHDPLAGQPWLVVASLDAAGREGRIYLAAAISLEEIVALFAEQLVTNDEVHWDKTSQTVLSRRCCRLDGLLLSEQRIRQPDSAAVQTALLSGIRQLGLQALPWTPAARQLQTRLICVGQWQPEADWPDLTDAALLAGLEEWLLPWLAGIRNIRGCAALNMEKILLARLDFQQQQRLERDAPLQIQVPSGSRIRLRYEAYKPPVLAVRLQEMFGLATTPTICQNRVEVLLHLLSPAGRPVQITRDLQTFWDTGYFEVRRELKGRYPKHHWPDKPWQAQATARIKRKKKKKK